MAPECPTNYEGEKLSRKLTIEYSIFRHITAAPCEKRKPQQESR